MKMAEDVLHENKPGAEFVDDVRSRMEQQAAEVLPEDSPHILIVGGDVQTLDFMSTALAQKGYRVDAVEDGKNAQEKIRTDQYHLVLTELKVPGASYIEILKAVQENSTNIGGMSLK